MAQFVVRSPRLDRAVNMAMSPVRASMSQNRRVAGKRGNVLSCVQSDAVEKGAFDLVYVPGQNGAIGRIQVYDSSRPSYDEAELAGRVYTDRWVACAKADFSPQDGIIYVKVVALGVEPRDGFRATVGFDYELPTETVDNPFYTEVIGEVEVKTDTEGKRTVVISRSRPLGNMQVLGRWL